MSLPLHEIAALGTAACWAMSAVLAADAVRALGAFHFNLVRQAIVTACLLVVVAATGAWADLGRAQVLLLAASGVIGILIGDTLNFAAVGRIGPRRAGAIFALNAPIAAILGWAALGERLAPQSVIGIGVTVAGVAIAILGRPPSGAHRLETIRGALLPGVICGLAAALGQATGALIARPVMTAAADPYLASLVRVGASGLAMGLVAVTPLAPPTPRKWTRAVLAVCAATAVIGLLIGMTLLLFALQASQTGIIATLSATSPVIILPLLWLRTGQRPTATSWLGAALAVAGLALIFTR